MWLIILFVQNNKIITTNPKAKRAFKANSSKSRHFMPNYEIVVMYMETNSVYITLLSHLFNLKET